MTAARPQTLGAFTITRELGRGGMGVVYAATHPRHGEVALKLLLVQTLAEPSALERFAREFQAVARLDHPGLVRVLDAGREGATPYVAMRFVAGEPLDARLRRGALPQEEAARLAEALAHALGHAHQRGVLHRDVKPRNVMIDESGAPVLVDFGLARLARADRITVTGELIGTPSYMAPEQASGETPSAIGPPADVYGLGATLYEMLAGAPPFVGPTVMGVLAKVLEERPAPPSHQRPGIDPALERLVLSCLEKDPAARPTIDALALALAAWRRGRARRGRARRGTRRWRVVVVGAIVSAAAIGIGIAVTRPEPPPAQPPVSLLPPPPVLVDPEPEPEPEPAPPPPEPPPAPRPEFDRARVLSRQAQDRLEAGDVADAVALLDQAEAVAPACADVWLVRAYLHQAVRDPETALADLARARACADPTADLVAIDSLQGSLLLQTKRRDEGLPYLERAYRDHRDPPPELCYYLGSALRESARPLEALEPLRRAVASGRFGWRAHFALAGALRALGRHDEAIAEYRRTAASPDYQGYFAQQREGETQLEAERPVEALAALRAAEALYAVDVARTGNRNMQLTVALALALIKTGSPEEGLRWADESAAIEPDFFRPHLARALALVALGRRDEARDALAVARGLGPTDPEVLRLTRELGP